mgnify:CR=1 FL=1
MKMNSYCYERDGMWYFRKKIPFQLNKKAPLYRISLKKLLGKKSYYISLLNASLFTITNYINNQVELLFLEVGSLTLEELNDYVISLLQKYEEKAIIKDNNYIGDIGKETKKIEQLRFNALSYFDEKGTQFGGHTKIALQKELDELRLAYDTDNIGLYRKKARDIINRQNIITQEEISKIPENMIQTFEENLVKKEMEVIIQDILNYDNLLNKKNVVSASPDLISFLESNPALNKLLGDMNKSLSNQDHWDLLIDKFLNGQIRAKKDTRTAEIALVQFSQIMLGDEELGIPKRNLVDINLDDINELKDIYKNFPKINNNVLKDMWRKKGILYTIAFTTSEKNKGVYKKSELGGIMVKIKIIIQFLRDIKLYEPEKYGNLNMDLWKRLHISFDELSEEDKAYNKANKKQFFDSKYIDSFLLNRYSDEYEQISGQAKRNFTRHTTGSPHVFWSLALGLFTGARAEELAQLRLRDFEKVDIDSEIIYYINLQITDPKKQSLKNLASERIIPISKYLIEWGFLNYVQERINEKADYLFDLTINKDRKRNGFQKNFNEDIKSHIKQFHPEHKGRLPSFHDLRSHFVSRFLNGKNDDINKLIELKKLIGHTNKDLHKDITIEVYYREPMEIKHSKYLMDNIDLKIDKGYKHIKEMINEKYNNVILKDLKF